MKWAYYNEIDEYCVAWLRNLITAGLIPDGEVDSRSITDVAPDDVRGFRQQHYFAGIGVWAHALRLAGYPDDREVWTGSCPCQPFSGAGKRAGFDDERHLWPAWFKLIEERRPVTVFGEQVASPHALAWLDLVFDDLEGAGYAAGAIDFPACGVGAPHIRQRLWWVADSDHQRCGKAGRAGGEVRTCGSGTAYGMADSQCDQWRQIGEDTGGRGGGGGAEGLEQRSLHGGALNGFWSTADWLLCRDGKHRPAQPGTRPLAHGVAARVVRVCPECLSRGQINGSVRAVRGIPDWNEGRRPAEVLQSGVYGGGSLESSADAGERPVSGAIPVPGGGVCEVRGNGETPPAPPGRRCDEQHAVEHRNPLLNVPFGGTPPAGTEIAVRGVRNRVHGGVAQEGKQDLLCALCGGVGPDLRQATLVGNRVGRLRGYGNAITAPAAAEFIAAFEECRP